MPLNNPLSLSFDRGKTFTLFLFFFFGFSNFRAREWTFPRGKTSYFLGMLLAGDLLTDARNFPLRSVFLCFFFFGTKGDNGIVVGFVWLCNALGRSTPSYFDFSRFKYCTIYILWFVRRGRGKGRNMLYAFYFYLRVFKRPVWISNNASSSSRKENREEPFREREGNIKIMEMGRWSRIRDMEGIVGESSHRWKSRLKYARSQLPRAVDSTQELLRATQRVYTDLVIYRFWPKYAAEIFFTDLFRHEKFRPVASYTLYWLPNYRIFEIIHEQHSFEIRNSFRIKRRKDRLCGKTMPSHLLIF